jgi:hypothetical protein
VWGTVLAINVTVWLLTAVGGGGTGDFWPMWLLIPTVAVGGLTLGATSVRRAHRMNRPPKG